MAMAMAMAMVSSWSHNHTLICVLVTKEKMKYLSRETFQKLPRHQDLRALCDVTADPCIKKSLITLSLSICLIDAARPLVAVAAPSQSSLDPSVLASPFP